MDISFIAFILIPICYAWLHLSSYPFYFNIIASCLLALLLLYMLVATTFLLPIEQVLFFLFYKDKIKSEPQKKKVAYDDEITRKIRELIGHIVRDFILDWYNTVSDDVHFVQEAFELFEHVFTGIRTRVSTIDAQIFMGHLLNFLSRHLACYQYAVRLAEKNSPNDMEKKRQLIIITYEKQLGHLAMSNYPDTETDHLRSLTAVLLKALLPRDYRLTGASLYVIRELISKNVLLPFIDILTDPHWINRNIVLVLSDHDEESSEDSDDAESVSSESEGLEIASLTMPALVEELPRPSAAAKPSKDLTVTFSVAANKDDLNLDVEYVSEIPDTSLTNEQVRNDSFPFPQTSQQPTALDNQSETGSLNFPDSSSDAGSAVEEKRYDFQDDRFFQRIRIPSAMTIEEPFDNGSKYTLYLIEYCAPSVANSQQTSDDVTTGERMEHYQVKRRFREFLTLQDRLNDKPVTRRLVNHVKAPSRMFPMPIGNMEKDYIEKRRKFLQAYMRELCTFPHVNNSTEMREFLAYNADPRIAFVRRPSNYIPRFDKLFKSVVQDLFGAATNKFTDKFSVTSSVATEEPLLVEPSSVSSDIFADAPPSPCSVTSSNDVMQSSQRVKNPVVKLKNIVLGRNSESGVFDEGTREYAPFTGHPNPNEVRFGRGWRTPENLLTNRTSYHTVGRRTQGDGCETHHFEYENNNKDLVTGRVFRLVYQIWKLQVGPNTLLYSSLGRFVKKYLELRVSYFTCEHQWIHYLKTLQRSLWPGGKWGGRDAPRDEEKMLQEAQKVLEDAFPDVLRHLLGNQRYSGGVAELLASFQEPLINRHVAYHLFDLLIKFLFPDLPTVITQATNVSL